MTDDTKMVSAKTRTLSDGTEIPLIGLGVWQTPDGPECVDAVRWALEAGYRHIDTAQAYGNEESVGRALRIAEIAREDVYITTKFDPSKDDAETELRRSLERLQMDYVDLYLVHAPKGGPTRAWDGMQRAHAAGLVRSIGISNFSADEVRVLTGVADVAPVVNQIQFSPFEYRSGLASACDAAGIAVEAYSPLGTGKHLGDETVGAIAQRLGVSPAQVLIRWSLQRGAIVLPKSTHKDRIASNADVFGFDLTDEDMATLDALDTTGGASEARENASW